MNLEDKFKGALVPEYKTFNLKRYEKLEKLDTDNKNMTIEQHNEYIKMMGQLVRIEINYKKAILPFIHNLMKGLVYLMVVLMTYLLIIGVPAATRDYLSYKSGNEHVERILKEKEKDNLFNQAKIDYYQDDNGNQWEGNNHGAGDKWSVATTQLYDAPIWRGKNGKIYSTREEARRN